MRADADADADGECPSEEVLLLYLSRLLHEATAAKIREHVLTCESCRDLVAIEAKESSSSSSSKPLGKYTIERELGSGGMGRVFRGRHEQLGKSVAIKMLHPEYAKKPRVVKRFMREARAAAALKSKHVVQVLDIDVTEEGEPFMVMELLSGVDLATLLSRKGPLPIDDAFRYLLDACDALTEAHEAGMLHRDIKPSNLFLTDDAKTPLVKVLDFGLVKALPGSTFLRSADHTALTSAHDLLGSPQFMAPEQFGGGPLDHRADIWSLGVTLYYLLAGEAPFRARDLTELRAKIERAEMDPISKYRTDLPPALIATIERCLCVDPAGRFTDVRELAEKLRELLPPEKKKGRSQPTSSTPTTTRSVPFDVGRYTAIRKIASGGMGSVYLARAHGALGFSRMVALKHLHAHLAETADTRRRFLAEARVVSQIDHPHVVKVLDVVESENAEDVFLVLEYVHGETLQYLLRAATSHTPLPLISSIFCEIAEALHAAHEAVDSSGHPLGIVHRDVSPHNVLVAKHGAAYVTDFGIAKVRAEIGDAHSNGIWGKVGYMAPEQMRGERNVSRSADIFALGVMLCEALTRQRLFQTVEQRMQREANGNHPIVTTLPSAVHPEASAALDLLVLAMTSRQKEDRPKTAMDVASRLREIAPPATSSVVAEWVKSLSSGKLERLEKDIGPLPAELPSGLTDTVSVRNETPTISWPEMPSSPSADAPAAAAVPKTRRAVAVVALLASLLAVALIVSVRFVSGSTESSAGARSPRTSSVETAKRSGGQAPEVNLVTPSSSVVVVPANVPKTTIHVAPNKTVAPPASTPVMSATPPQPPSDPFPSIRK